MYMQEMKDDMGAHSATRCSQPCSQATGDVGFWPMLPWNAKLFVDRSKQRTDSSKSE